MKSSATTAAALHRDPHYTINADALTALRASSPWRTSPKYFTHAAISPTALMKMMTHTQSGVEKGIRKGGNPVEVMGLMLGRPATDDDHDGDDSDSANTDANADANPPTKQGAAGSKPAKSKAASDKPHKRTLLITDVFPLPIEGFETRVIADDSSVINHMISLSDSLERRTPHEKFMGWYHSHPFELSSHSHCYLSQTDVSTQLIWQRAEDPHGNPFLAIVVDPIRSMSLGEPCLKAFRAYPPDYTLAMERKECPDGSVVDGERERLEKWGSCWSSYYELEVEYFIGGRGRGVMEGLGKEFLWMRMLTGGNKKKKSGVGNSGESGNGGVIGMSEKERDVERVEKAAAKLRSVDINNERGSGASEGGNGMRSLGDRSGGSGSRSTEMISEGGAASSTASSQRGRSSRSNTAASASNVGAGTSSSGATSSTGTAAETSSEKDASGGELGKACQAVVDIATEKLIENLVQVSKRELFS
ncbi:hypothetical protein ACHAXS_004696 [Conticribra weissflogii]